MILQRFILAAGIRHAGDSAVAFLAAAVWAQISQVGAWGSWRSFRSRYCDHLLNALGWRFASAPKTPRACPSGVLVKGRMAGDGVNYLTPSGTIAGEFVRPGLWATRLRRGQEQQRLRGQALAGAGPAGLHPRRPYLRPAGHLNILEGRELVLSLAGTFLAMSIMGWPSMC